MSIHSKYGGLKVVEDQTRVNAQTGTAYTLVIGDVGNIVTMDNPAANTVTIPTNVNVSFPVGAVMAIDTIGVGLTTIQGDTGVTVNGASGGSETITTQNFGVSIKKIGTDTWLVQGGI